jgi:hypothetical protein
VAAGHQLERCLHDGVADQRRALANGRHATGLTGGERALPACSLEYETTRRGGFQERRRARIGGFGDASSPVRCVEVLAAGEIQGG